MSGGLAQATTIDSSRGISNITGAVAITSSNGTLQPMDANSRYVAFKFIGFSLHLATAAATSENFVVTLDAVSGTAYDTIVYSRDMSGIKDIYNIFSEPIQLIIGDKVIVTYANTDTRIYGLKLFYKLL